MSARAAEPEDGVYRFSATKITTWLECQRKFGWTYIAKVPRPTHASAALGSACHAQLEKYLAGEPLNFSEVDEQGRRPADIVAPGIADIPAPNSPGLEIEAYFRFLSPAGHTFIGYKDVRVVGGPVPLVLDHKTTSDLRWAKSEAELREDVQAAIYAWDEFRRAPEAQAVDLQWQYYQTRGAKRSEPVKVRIDRAENSRVMRAIDLVADEIAATISSVSDVKTLAPNAAACEKYGGCPFRDRCNLSPIARITSMANANTKGSIDLMARLQERATGAAPYTPEWAKTPAGLPSTTPPAAASEALPDWLTAPVDPGPGASMRTPEEARTATREALPAPAALAAPPPAPAASPFPATDMPINPPEFQRAPTPEERTAADAAEKAAKAGPSKATADSGRIRRTKEEIAAGLTVEQVKAARAGGQSAPLVTEALTTIQAAVDAGQITPAEGAKDAAYVGEIAAALDPAHADALKAIAESGAMPAPAQKHEVIMYTPPEGLHITKGEAPAAGFTLYVDCLPHGREVQSAERLIAEAHRQLRDDLGVVDYRLVDYGKGAGLLAHGVAILAEGRTDDLYLDTSTPEGSAVKSRLVAAAAEVIQGVR